METLKVKPHYLFSTFVLYWKGFCFLSFKAVSVFGKVYGLNKLIKLHNYIKRKRCLHLHFLIIYQPAIQQIRVNPRSYQ